MEKNIKRTWQEAVPKHEIYETKVKRINYKISPDSKGFMDLMADIVDDEDGLRPMFGGVNFDSKLRRANITDGRIAFVFPYFENYEGTISPTGFDISKDNPVAKYPDVGAIIRKEYKFSYSCDLRKLKTYCEILLRLELLNKDVNQAIFYYDKNKVIAFNVKLIIQVCNVFLKMGREYMWLHIENSNSGMLFGLSDISNFEGDKAIVMPLMTEYKEDRSPLFSFANDDLGFQSYTFGYSFELNSIVGPDFKEIPLNLLAKPKTAMQGGLDVKLFKKLQSVFGLRLKTTVPIMKFALVKDKTLKITNLECWLEIKNVSLPDGFYQVRGNSLVSVDGFKFDDFPSPPKSVAKTIPTASINLDEFNYHFEKAIKFVGKDEFRPVMNKIVISDKYVSGLEISSTDAFAMYRQKLKRIGKEADRIGEIIVPYPTALVSLSKFLNCGFIDIFKNDKTINLECAEFKYTFLQDEKEQYPNYGAVWGIDASTNQFSIDSVEFKNLLKEVNQLIKKNKGLYEIFKINFKKDGQIVLTGANNVKRGNRYASNSNTESKNLEFFQLKSFSKIYNSTDDEFKNKDSDDFERAIMPMMSDVEGGNIFAIEMSVANRVLKDFNSKEITFRYSEPNRIIHVDGFNDWKEPTIKKPTIKKTPSPKASPKESPKAIVGEKKFFKGYDKLSPKGKKYQDAINGMMDLLDTFEAGDKQIDLYAQAILGLARMRDMIEEEDDLPF